MGKTLSKTEKAFQDLNAAGQELSLAYLPDLIHLCLANRITKREVAITLGVSFKTLDAWLKRKEKLGSK